MKAIVAVVVLLFYFADQVNTDQHILVEGQQFPDHPLNSKIENDLRGLVEADKEVKVSFPQKRIAVTLALGIFGAVMGSANFLNGVIGGAISRQTMAEIKEQLNVIEQKVDQLSDDVQSVLSGQAHLSNVIHYNDDVQRLEYLLHYFQREITLNDGSFTPTNLAEEWADNVLALTSDGIDQVLLNIHKMIIGDSVLSPDSILITFESLLNRNDLSYVTKFQQFVEYTMDLQASGYALWIYALQIEGRDVANVQELHSQRLAEQESFLLDVGLNWPAGQYGLAMVNSGCPTSLGFTWQQGWRYHDTEDSNNANSWSSNNHFAHTGSNINQKFCMKDNAGGNGDWPSGNYCILPRGNTCPSSFSCGWIYWDDEDSNNNNDYAQPVPRGEYGRNTKIWYACRNDGSADQAILLPSSRPFYLYQYTGNCQKVKNMAVSSEWLYFDNEDDDNADSQWGAHPKKEGSRNIKLFYCYYEPLLFKN